jgi:hypothetical protein
MANKSLSQWLSKAVKGSVSLSAENLLAAARAGDEAAVSQLFFLCYPWVCSSVRRRKANRAVASLYDGSEVASDVLKTLVTNPADDVFTSLETVGDFLVRVTEQRLIDEHRKGSSVLIDPFWTYQQVCESIDEVTAIVWHLDRLGYSASQISQIMRCSYFHLAKRYLEVSAKFTEIRELARNPRSSVTEAQDPLDPVIAQGQVEEGGRLARGAVRAAQTTWERVVEFREEWFEAGTSVEPADRPRAEAAIAQIYVSLEASPPRFVWCGSPMAAQLALCDLEQRPRPRRSALSLSVPASVRGAPDDALGASTAEVWLGDALQAANSWLSHALLASTKRWLKVSAPTPGVRALLGVGLVDRLRGAEGALLESALLHTLTESLRALKTSYRETPFQGQPRADWIRRFVLCRDVVGVRYEPHLSKRLDWWAELVRSGLWWWPYREICLVSERPAEIHVLDGERLHNDSGPAVRFHDGWSIWALNGVLVDEQVVLHPETQSLPQIRREQNAEVKRIRIERYGWDRYLAEVGATVIDRRRNDIEATRETLLRGPDSETVLVCACPSTARIYALRVPPEIQTCQEAQAWLSGGLAGRIINGA